MSPVRASAWSAGMLHTIAARILDAFNRTVAGALGIADTGQPWVVLRGVWFANGTQAQSDTAASSYALAAVPVGGANATTSAVVTQGCGPAAWVTDANNWWASFHYTTSTGGCGGGATGYIYTASPACTCGAADGPIASCDGPAVSCSDSTNTCSPGGCGTVTSTAACTGPNVSCNDYTNTCSPGGCGGVTSSFVAQYNCYGGYTVNNCAPSGGTWNGSQCCFTENYYTRTQATTQYTRTQATTRNLWRCTDSPTTVTAHKLRLISDVSGVISTVADVTLASAPAAVKIVTAGDTITASAYSDTAMTGLLGTNAATPASPVKGAQTGIVKAPGGTAQGSTIDSFNSSI